MAENRRRRPLTLLLAIVSAGCAFSPPADDTAMTESAVTNEDPLPPRAGCPGTWERVHDYGGLAGGQYTGVGDMPWIVSATFSDIWNVGGPHFQGHYEATVRHNPFTAENYVITGGFLASGVNSAVRPYLTLFRGPPAPPRGQEVTTLVVYGVRQGADNTIRELCLVTGGLPTGVSS